MNLKSALLLGGVALGAVPGALAQSAWLPEQNQWLVTPGFTYSTFDEFWAGRTKVENPPNGKSLDQYFGYLFLEYGLLENLAADLTVGYTATESDAFGNVSDDGIADTYFGLRYRFLDEHRAPQTWMPSLALRLGGVIAGSYEENTPFSAGDGAHAFESSLLMAKAVGDTGFGFYGDIGYRVREEPVPDDFFASVGIYQQFGPVTLNFGYRHVQGLDGLDIGGPGFNPADEDTGFPAVKEINQLVQGGISYTDRGGRSYQFTVAGSVDGRNTGDKLIFGLSATFPITGP